MIPSYAYTYIKIGFLKQLIMNEFELEQMKNIYEIKEFIEYITPFYPDLTITNYTIDEIEKSLYHIYIKIVGKILNYSPENMRIFLKNYLLKYEIMNIKLIILGSIAGMSMEEKEKKIDFIVEEYLENRELMREMLKISSLDEIQLFMRRTRYNKAIREGILYYKHNKEVFVLESFLDQLYYENLSKKIAKYNKKERAMIPLFVNYKTEIYNINMIYRGIKNNIDRKLLNQFLVKKYLFLDEKKTNFLLNLNTIGEFISKIDDTFKNAEELKNLYRPLILKEKHLVRSIENLYMDYYFKKFKIKIDDIDYSTIYRLLEVIIKKEKEVKFELLPRVVKIINERYRILKSHLK